MSMNAPGVERYVGLLRPQLRHVPASHWCERARVQAQGGPQTCMLLRSMLVMSA